MPERIWITNGAKDRNILELIAAGNTWKLEQSDAKASAHYTTEELHAMGLVGVYRIVENNTTKEPN